MAEATEVVGHPAIVRVLATPGAEAVCFADNGVRKWLRVTLPDGRRFVLTVPSELVDPAAI